MMNHTIAKIAHVNIAIPNIAPAASGLVAFHISHGLSAALAIVDNVVISKTPANKIDNFIEFFTLFT